MTPKTVGRIVLEDADGQPSCTADYAAHPAVRAPSLAHQGVIYLQNRVEGTRWVYRATAEPAGVPVPHRELSDIRPLDHPDYDGPPRPTVESDLCPTCGQRVHRG